MITYKKLSENAGKFLAMTGYTVEEFQALLPFFQAEFEKWVRESRLDGKPRNDRKYTDYKNSPLPAAEEKLIFILIYLKQAPTQEVHAALFDMQQPVANKWIHRLHPVLNRTLDTLGELPDRTAGDFIVTLRDENENVNMNINISADADRNEDEDADRNRERNADVNMNVTLSLCESESVNMSENGNENADADADKEWNADVSMNVSLSENEGVNMSVNGNEDANKNMERNANVNMNVTLSLCENENENENSFFFHDGTERPINRPKDTDGQKTYYSGRKKQHTLKNNIVSGEDCKVIFLTETCEGKKSDKKVADEAGYILPKGSILYQDTGFQGFGPEGVIILQPEKKPKGGELTPEQKDRNRGISRVRVRVEHVIGGVKRYRIVKDKLRNWKKGFRDKVMETCCGLHNFRLNFRPWKYAAI